jgi:hypothetical protein
MAIFGFKELATSNGLNTKVQLKTEQGDKVTGTVDYEDANGLSGDDITNIQKTVNQASSETFDVLITTNDQIAIKQYKGEQIYLLEGDGGAATLNTLPFDVTNISEDVEVILVGKSNTNTVTIAHNDVADGAILNGNATLEQYFILRLKYITALNRFIEISRNF